MVPDWQTFERGDSHAIERGPRRGGGSSVRSATAREFYEQKLGLPPGVEEDGGVRYPCAHGTALFVYVSPENAGSSRATVAGWFVDDLDQTVDDLVSRGVTFEQYDQPGIKTNDRGVFDNGRLRAA